MWGFGGHLGAPMSEWYTHGAENIGTESVAERRKRLGTRWASRTSNPVSGSRQAGGGFDSHTLPPAGDDGEAAGRPRYESSEAPAAVGGRRGRARRHRRRSGLLRVPRRSRSPGDENRRPGKPSRAERRVARGVQHRATDVRASSPVHRALGRAHTADPARAPGAPSPRRRRGSAVPLPVPPARRATEEGRPGV